MRLSSVSLAPFALLLCASCAGPRLVPAEAGSFRAGWLKTAVTRVLVLPSADAGQPTEILGVIDVHEPHGGQDEALETMKERAALLGADAVLGVELHHEAAKQADVETHLSGLAVRLRPLLQQKPYDVLGQVQTEAEMGHEKTGLDDLRAQAGNLGADLLVDVQFHHGEGGGEKTHLSGTAIKYR